MLTSNDFSFRKKIFLYFCYRNETDLQINDIFSSDCEEEYSTERLKLKNEKQVYFLV